MTNTALGAGAEKAQEIIFISEAHEKFYYEKLKEVRYQDVYHKALCYCLGINDDTRRNANRIYDFKTGCVKTECLHEGWQTRGSVKVVRMAYTVCQHFGIDTSDYSFGYIAGWSSGRDTKVLRSSMDTIRRTASELITGIEEQLQELQRDREVSQEQTKESILLIQNLLAIF